MAALTKKLSASEVNKSKDVKVTPISYPFWFGGSASCFATFFTHPLDLGKPQPSVPKQGTLKTYTTHRDIKLTNEGPITNTSTWRGTNEHVTNVRSCRED
jgi:hypothetical protein